MTALSQGRLLSSLRALDAADRSLSELSTALVEATDALICIVDGGGSILLANTALQRFTGRTAADLVGRRLWDVLVIPEEVTLAQQAVADAMAGRKSIPKEVDWLAAQGRRRRVALKNSDLLDELGRPYGTAFIGMDVTEERRHEALARHHARTDPLTGLSNRRALFEALTDHLDAGTGAGCGLLFCDVDAFKDVNDDHGHAAGDQLLIDLATQLRRLAGPRDLVARLGGDEFVLLSPGADQVALTALADRVERHLRIRRSSGGSVPIGLSIGTAIGHPGEDPDGLLTRADLDMYRVKSRRRGDREQRSAVPHRCNRPPRRRWLPSITAAGRSVLRAGRARPTAGVHAARRP
jgi:diguanylate cyclase (GGDEF)-like protein/PAS domain S-box-containing protein